MAKFLALSKDKQLAYQNVMDYAKASAKEEGRQEGIEKGIVQGIEKGKKERNIEIAQISLKQNIDIPTIAMITNLTIEEIEKLKK